MDECCVEDGQRCDRWNKVSIGMPERAPQRGMGGFPAPPGSENTDVPHNLVASTRSRRTPYTMPGAHPSAPGGAAASGPVIMISC